VHPPQEVIDASPQTVGSATCRRPRRRHAGRDRFTRVGRATGALLRRQGAQIWNSRATNVRLLPVPAGRTPNIRVYADNGWPRTYSTSLGNGRWYMGREAVEDGYYPPRIAAHEFGHILGLPDRRTGLCADLMSGSSAPVSCTQAYPNNQETTSVDAKFRSPTVVPARSFDWQGGVTAGAGVG
jgi:snapalysin